LPKLSRKLGRGAAALALIVGVLLVAGAPADAHQTYSRIRGPGGVVRGEGLVTQDHQRIYVCDTKFDSIGVWVEFFHWDPHIQAFRYSTLRDEDGASGNCWSIGFANGAYVGSWRGHSTDGGETPWINA